MGLVNNISFPTHYLGHTLDLVLTRQADSVNLVTSPLEYISDHLGIKVQLSINKPSSTNKLITYRKVNDINVDNFRSDLLECDLISNLDHFDDLGELVDKYNSSLEMLLEKHAPMKEKIIKIRESAIWYNSALRALKKTKRYYENNWVKNRTSQNLDLFKHFKNEYTLACNKVKTEYYSKLFSDCGSNQRKIYKLIDDLTNGDPPPKYPIESNNIILANNFCEFFTSKIENIVSDIEVTVESESLTEIIQYDLLDDSFSPLEDFREITREELESVMSSLGNKYSPLDPLPTSLIKKFIDILIKPIHKIINRSLESGIFPQQLKSAVITPIIKKNNLEAEYQNFRPVSNIPYLSKLIEKVVLSQCMPHFITSNQYSKNNSAYMKNNSTETLLAKVHSDVIENTDKKMITLLVLIDLSAAFDSLNQEKLIHILENMFKITGNSLNWFKTYLIGRSQRVIVNSTLSSAKPLKYGVPQGSCLGPVAFLAYTSAIYNIIHRYNISVEAYADDTQLYIACDPSNKSISIKLNILERCIQDVRTFLLTHQLKINDNKTELIIIGNRQQLAKIDFESISLRVGSSNIRPTSKKKT